ncbi:hypothetical protein [Daejeonella oryzae]|uniref:hypothetical protein n=1 Tax=Daejeonella oryzae TaxID=1122943 RepID=UPI0003F74E45|nr:hypothetical protein [Daejeonella oryzae]
MRINIDVDESIRTERLKVVHKDYFQKFESVFYIFASLLLIFIGLFFPTLMTFQGITEGRDKIVVPLVIFSPFILAGLLTLYALINDNRLRRFRGLDEKYNREVVSKILEQRFGIAINKSGGRTMRIYKKATCWKWGIRVIVIYDERDVLITVSRFNNRGTKSPFHPWFDDRKIKAIINEFNEIKKNTA